MTSRGRPFLESPLTGFFHENGEKNIQRHGRPLCKKFQLKYMDCLAAYGAEKGYLNCADYLDDLEECVNKTKQLERVRKLRAERLKQVNEGKAEFIPSPEPEIFYER